MLKAAQSLHKIEYIHNDIRLWNVVHDSIRKKSSSNDYILIDFEDVEKINCTCPNKNHRKKNESTKNENCPTKDIAGIQNFIPTLYENLKPRRINKEWLELQSFFKKLDRQFSSITGFLVIGETLTLQNRSLFDTKLKQILNFLK